MIFYEIIPVTQKMVTDELNGILSELPGWRYEYSMSYRFDIDRYLCAKSFVVLKMLLKRHYGIIQDIEFEYGSSGKPILKHHPEIHFNISHCHAAIICAVADEPVGVDIEEIQFDKLLASSVLSETEKNNLERSDNIAAKFTEYWVQKESYMKLLGTGLTDNLKNLLDNTKGRVIFQTFIDTSNSYAVSIARYKN